MGVKNSKNDNETSCCSFLGLEIFDHKELKKTTLHQQ